MMLSISQPWFERMAVDWGEVGIWAACVLGALLALALWGGSVWAGWQGLRRKQQVVFPLRLTSQSNLPIRYRLRVELGGLQKSVGAFWQQDGVRLPGLTIKHYRYVQETPPPKPVPVKGKTAPKTAKKPGEAQAGAKKVGSIANLVASITGTLAALLPGPLKAPFRAINTAIRERQKEISLAKAEVNHLQSSTRSIDRDLKRLGNTAGVKGAGNGSKAAGAAGASADEEDYRRVITTEIPVTETIEFDPGESGLCQLILRPTNPLRSVSGSFQVESQPVELKEYPIYGIIPSATLSADLNIQAVRLYQVLFALLVLGVGALCVWGGVAWIRWLLFLRG